MMIYLYGCTRSAETFGKYKISRIRLLTDDSKNPLAEQTRRTVLTGPILRYLTSRGTRTERNIGIPAALSRARNYSKSSTTKNEPTLSFTHRTRSMIVNRCYNDRGTFKILPFDRSNRSMRESCLSNGR